MASSGIHRKVDDLGRVVIPAGIRRALHIREGDTVEVSVEGERVVLARPHEACVFCGGDDGALQTFHDRQVCRDCLRALGSADARARADERAAAASAAPPDAQADPARRQVRPAWATGPIDGDELARQGVARHPRPDADQGSVDPASTTAW